MMDTKRLAGYSTLQRQRIGSALERAREEIEAEIEDVKPSGQHYALMQAILIEIDLQIEALALVGKPLPNSVQDPMQSADTPYHHNLI